MITIEQNLNGTYTLKEGKAKMIFATYELAKEFILDYANGEIKVDIEI